VFASGIDVTMVGLDVTHKALFTPAHEERLQGKVGEMVRALLGFYGNFHREIYNFNGSPIHDAVAVAHVIRDDLLTTKNLNTEIDVESELSRGRTVVDLWRRTQREPNSHVAVDIDADDFLDLLIERLNSFA
jgi:inosine-uridine nucleoside N-ribohydrolase